MIRSSVESSMTPSQFSFVKQQVKVHLSHLSVSIGGCETAASLTSCRVRSCSTSAGSLGNERLRMTREAAEETEEE